MKKERKRLNKKIVAFILALSMILGQTSVLFATESGNAAVPEAPAAGETVSPVEGQADPSLAGDAQTPEKAETAEGADPASQEVKAPETQTEGTEDAAEAEKKQEAVSDDATEASEVSEDKAQASAAAETEIEENAGASGNKISLSGGSISVNIPAQSGNEVNYYSASENLYYVSGCTVSEAKLSGKKTGMNIGFKFTVVSDNASVNKVLKEGEDYKVTWYFAPAFDENGKAVSADKLVPVKVEPGYIPDRQGFVTVSIDAAGDRYENSISFKLKVEEKPQEKLVSGDLIAEVSDNVITVSNNSDKYMFFDLVKKTALTVSQSVVPNILIPHESVQMIAYYRDNGAKKIVTESMNIAVVASAAYDFNSTNSQVYKVLSVVPAVKTDIHDGYSEINMKAYVDRNTQLMKISWAPKSDLKYKTYELLRMNESGDFEPIPEWKDARGNTKLSKKNFSYKYNKNAAKDKDGIERAAKPAIFLLRCYDAEGKKTEYLTVAAPSLLYVEPSYTENSMEYCFSELYSTPGLSYKLELAEKKKEKGEDAEGKRGFAETEKYAAEIFSEDAYGIEDYLVKKGISVNAIVGDFIGNDSLKLKIGTQYFCRVKTKYYYKGKEFSSAPSNVLSRKAGPTKAFVFDVNGVRYEKPAGANKSTIEQQNAERMRRHISAWIEDQTVSADIYTHMSNQGPDAKSGYVVFLTEKNKDNSIKGFELLRSETQYGTYKKIKAYNLDRQGNPAKNSGLAKFEGAYDYELLKHYDIYYMWFNNFPPEKTFYYAVRAVSRTGGAQGGFGDGYECRVELDKVSKLYALDGKINKINLYWKHDDCVKKYKIFRRDMKPDNPEKFDPTDGSGWTQIALANGGKSGTLKESDKNLTKGEKKDLYEATSGNLVGDYNKFIDKKNVRTGHVYDYAIVPVYDIKNKDMKYNIDKVSDIVPGVATLEGVKIKNFKASNGGVHKINTSWSKIIQDTNIEYLIIRTIQQPANPEKPAEWLQLWLNNNGVLYDEATVGDTRPLVYVTTERTFKDQKAKVGQTYYYAIFAGDFPDDPKQITVESLSDVVYKTAKSVPLAAANIEISEGSNIRYGAHVRFTKNAADRDEWSSITYVLQGNVNGYWKDIVSSTNNSGTVDAWDGNELRRGVERKYRVISYYGDYQGGVRESGVYSKPNKVEWSGNTNIMQGEETKISVYAKCGGSAAFVNDIDYSIKGNISVSKKEKEGDHYVLTVKGNGTGTGTLTVSAKGWNDYTDGSSKDDLRKHITINVRSISPIK